MFCKGIVFYQLCICTRYSFVFFFFFFFLGFILKVVACTAANVMCSWTGLRQALTTHIITCPYVQLKPVLLHLQTEVGLLQAKVADVAQNGFKVEHTMALYKTQLDATIQQSI